MLTTLNNYFGCKVWSEGSCLQCSDRFFFNKNGVCVEVQGTCQQFNSKEGICEKCYEGYAVVDGKCAKVDRTSNNNLGCALWKDGLCTQCSKRWFFNADKVCAPISDLCSEWNADGTCSACYYGYIVSKGACVENNDVSVVPNSNLLCRTWSGKTCTECADRTYFNKNGLCTPVSAQCNTFDKSTGHCLTCFAGYDVVDGACVYSPANTAAPADLGCANWDWNNQVCLACSKRWAFNANKICVPVADQCATHADNGNCLACFKGYDLKDGKCLFSTSNNAKPADSGCATWDWDNQVCLACSKGWVFNSNKACTPVSDQCASHDSNGNCLTCFKGYDLKEGACVFSAFNNAKPADSGCGTWDWDNQKCLACSFGWVFNQNRNCVPVSDQCKTNDDKGNCLTCFKGYDLKNGVCIFSDFNKAKPSDSGCATWDWDNQVCLACSKRWTFNANKVCVPVSDQCASHNENGQCLTCFKGYDLKDGACVFSSFNNAKPADSGCATWDWDNQLCLACSKNWVFNTKKVCVPVSDQCKTNDDSGNCLSCFKGYDLKEGACIFSSFNNAKPADSGCATWDWDNQVCLACSKRWAFNANKVCVPVSDQCASSDSNGNCLTCYKGYDLKDGACVFSSFNNAKPADSGCATWDWDNQVCLACSKRWAFNANKVCVPVSDQCASNDENGNCLSCYKGYDLKDGACVFSPSNNAKPADSGCGTWDWDNQVCLACSKGWFFNAQKKCVPISDQCATSDSKGNCLSCYSGYDLKEGACLFSDFNNAHPADIGCASWDWKNQVCLACSKRWFFNAHKTCVPVDDNCNNHDEKGACTSCYQGYGVNNGICVSVNPLCKTLNADGTCASCYPQNVVHNGSCVPINKLANILLYYAACCPEKLAELQAKQKSN